MGDPRQPYPTPADTGDLAVAIEAACAALIAGDDAEARRQTRRAKALARQAVDETFPHTLRARALAADSWGGAERQLVPTPEAVRVAHQRATIAAEAQVDELIAGVRAPTRREAREQSAKAEADAFASMAEEIRALRAGWGEERRQMAALKLAQEQEIRSAVAAAAAADRKAIADLQGALERALEKANAPVSVETARRVMNREAEALRAKDERESEAHRSRRPITWDERYYMEHGRWPSNN